jgi:hypothetical protein
MMASRVEISARYKFHAQFGNIAFYSPRCIISGTQGDKGFSSGGGSDSLFFLFDPPPLLLCFQQLQLPLSRTPPRREVTSSMHNRSPHGLNW